MPALRKALYVPGILVGIIPFFNATPYYIALLL